MGKQDVVRGGLRIVTELWAGSGLKGVYCMHSSLAIHLIVLVPPGVVFGAGNTAATLAGFISVPATGYLLQVRGQGL